jgi:hypothetical protein
LTDKTIELSIITAWGITYDLFWLHLVKPDFDGEFISDVLTQSALLTAHLIGLRGVPILGRSVIYRTAVPVPLLAESIADPSAATCGRARRALDAVWRYFIAHGCLRNGTLTQGYFDSDPRLVERYMVPEAAIGGFDRWCWPTCMRPGAGSGRLRTSHFLSRWRITAWSSKSSDG